MPVLLRIGHMNPVLSVIGTGYLGATHAACMSSLGFTVVGIDTDKGKITQLSIGELPFYEPGLDELLKVEIASGRLTFYFRFLYCCSSGYPFYLRGNSTESR